MEPLSLKFFGDVKLLHDLSREITLPRKTKLLLACLALSAERQHSRDKLAALLWSTRSEEQARHSLRQCLFTLDKSLGDGGSPLIHADRTQLSLNRELVDVDVWQFERHVTAGSPDDLQRAALLYGGDLLAGLEFENETLDTWCSIERTRLRDQFHEVLATLTTHHIATVDLDAAIQTSRRLVRLDPLREDAHRTLMRIYQRAGRRADAFKQYRECVEILRRELSVKPEAATTDLYIKIRGQSAESDASTENSVSPSNDPRPVYDAMQELAQAIGRRKFVALVTGVALLVTLAGLILWLSMWRS